MASQIFSLNVSIILLAIVFNSYYLEARCSFKSYVLALLLQNLLVFLLTGKLLEHTWNEILTWQIDVNFRKVWQKALHFYKVNVFCDFGIMKYQFRHAQNFRNLDLISLFSNNWWNNDFNIFQNRIIITSKSRITINV